jgi:hypothetical protein
MTNLNYLIDDFAIRSFRDQADGDYISARMACRAALVGPFLWASQQTIEKYLKCILLLNRIPAKRVMHDLLAAIEIINASGKLTIALTPLTHKFIERIDLFGRFRYLETSNVAFGSDLVSLDRAVWELRRYCAFSDIHMRAKLRNGVAAPRVRLPGGSLESIIDDVTNPARQALLWQNGFFGKRIRKRVKVNRWMKAANSPLYLHPEILDEVLKYVFLPRELISAIRSQRRVPLT